MDEDTRIRLVELTAEVVSAYVSNNHVFAGELGTLIGKMHETLTAIATGGATSEKPKEPQEPAVPIRKSITPDYIISLEDGRKFKSLKRHLAAHYGMTPDDYRAKWNLPADYPMVAPNYAARRSEMASHWASVARLHRLPLLRQRNVGVRKLLSRRRIMVVKRTAKGEVAGRASPMSQYIATCERPRSTTDNI